MVEHKNPLASTPYEHKWLTTSYTYIIIDDIIEALTVLSIWYQNNN